MNSFPTDFNNERRFDFQSAAAGCTRDTFAVVEMSGEEAISQPYRFDLVLVSMDERLDLDAVLGAPACLRILGPVVNGVRVGDAAPYHGMLAEFEQLEQLGAYTFYRAQLVPRLWALSQYRNSEVYLHEQSITDIIKSVLDDVPASPGLDYTMSLTAVYRPRSYVCQYQESPLDFISRWMEREGIYYHFEQDTPAGADDAMGRERLVLLDARIVQPAQARAVAYRPAGELDVGLSADSIQSFVCRTRRLPKAVVLQDFNYRRAGLPLQARAEVSPNGLGEEMLYGENFRSPEEGERYALIRAQELLCGGQVFSGNGTAMGLRSGRFIDLSLHYRGDFDGRYLVTRVTHEGSQAGALLAGMSTPYNQREGRTHYRNSFEALREHVQFRAPRTTPRPRVAGTMTATIDAEGSGEYAELDEYGQYKVQVPFDSTDKAAAKGSARIRMATPYAGSDHGMHFPLLKGAEVLLSFADGDPDQPVITGAVPNSLNPSVIDQTSAHDNLISTKGGNQLLMKDTEGKEVIWLNSPFHKSSIGVGSILPQGGGSIFEATSGGSDKVSFGTNNSMSFGSSNSLGIGSDASVKASFSNGVSMGSSIAISASSGIKWNMDLTLFHKDLVKTNRLPSFSIDDTSSVKVSESFGGNSHKTATVCAGLVETDLKTVDFKSSLRWFRGMVGAFTAVNFAQSTAFGMAVNGSAGGAMVAGSDGKSLAEVEALKRRKAKSDAYKTAQAKKSLDDLFKKKAAGEVLTPEEEDTLKAAPQDEKYRKLSDEEQALLNSPPEPLTPDEDARLKAAEAEGKKSPMVRSNLHGWPGILGKFGVDALVNVAGLIAFQYWARTMAGKLNDLKYVSRTESGVQGIVHAVNGADGPDGVGPFTSVIEMRPDTGVGLLALPRDGGAAKKAAIYAVTEVLDFGATSSAKFSAPEVSLGDEKLTAGFVSKAGDVTSMFCDTTRIDAKAGQLSLSSAEIQIGDHKVVDQRVVFGSKLDVAKAARDVAKKALDAAKQSATTISRHASLAGVPMPPGPEQAVRAAQKALDDAEAEVRSAQADLMDASATFTAGPLLHGFSVGASEASLKFGTAGVKASNAGLALSMGNAKAEFTTVGLSLDGSVIKLG